MIRVFSGNGHTASLFPETAVLHEEKRAVAPVHAEEEDFYRVTLTAPTLNHAAVVAFVVSGISRAPGS
jgi:6-phosphogluconolactonase